MKRKSWNVWWDFSAVGWKIIATFRPPMARFWAKQWARERGYPRIEMIKVLPEGQRPRFSAIPKKRGVK